MTKRKINVKNPILIRRMLLVLEPTVTTAISKVVRRKSHWSHLSDLCCKLGIKLHLREDGLYVLIVEADEEAEIMLESSQAFFKCFKQLKRASNLDEWKVVSQGRMACADNIDSSISSSHPVNFHLSDSLVKFVLKARLQLRL